jgi:hypothetical protein
MITLSGKNLVLSRLLDDDTFYASLLVGPVVPASLALANIYSTEDFTYTVSGGIAIGNAVAFTISDYVNIGYVIIHNADTIVDVSTVNTTYAPGTVVTARCNLHF